MWFGPRGGDSEVGEKGGGERPFCEQRLSMNQSVVEERWTSR